MSVCSTLNREHSCSILYAETLLAWESLTAWGALNGQSRWLGQGHVSADLPGDSYTEPQASAGQAPGPAGQVFVPGSFLSAHNGVLTQLGLVLRAQGTQPQGCSAWRVSFLPFLNK